ncbi:hypothetical protein BXZ70DRAFT_911457 [Cristinia sonorae]|uniref:Uncharacterized protein n=1 Tax=Cristinia sonorae TaxID=1940300 RepID=A0A8K0UEA7_9AGAR|nr:hypothetical protein BXZ70DRAFT_911457 [Cristinia sonorae]
MAKYSHRKQLSALDYLGAVHWYNHSTKTQSEQGYKSSYRQERFFFISLRNRNWQKIVGLGALLCSKYLKAVENLAEQEEEFQSFTAGIGPTTKMQWTAHVLAWEADPNSAEDLYIAKREGPSETQVRRTLAEEEAAAANTSGGTFGHEVSPMAFLAVGLDLERQQRQLKADTAKKGDVPETDVIRRRTMLHSQIAKFREIQAIYMPSVPQRIALTNSTTDDSATSRAEDSPLHLPSSFSIEEHGQCAFGLVAAEEQLREGQCNDSLDDIRSKLYIKARLITYKKNNSHGQGMNTRSRTLLNCNDSKIKRSVQKYRVARAALLSLRGPGKWEEQLRVLQDEHLRMPSEDDEATARKRKKRKGPAEGTRVASWIWHTSSAQTGLNNVLQVEWLKARSRVARWREEVAVLKEEHRRTGVYLRWKAEWWRKQANLRSTGSVALVEGLSAYTARQAFIREALADRFDCLWEKSLKSIEKASKDGGHLRGQATSEGEDDNDGDEDDDDNDGEDGNDDDNDQILNIGDLDQAVVEYFAD